MTICDLLKPWLGALVSVVFMAHVSSAVRSAQDFQNKVSLLLRDEPANPKCFIEEKKDFTCFWEEDQDRAQHGAQYSFTYAYQQENSSHCPLRTLPGPDGRRLLVCHLNSPHMFVQMDIEVQRDGVRIHNRSVLVELVFLLDPPRNLSVSQTKQQGQLRVTWVPPALKYMDDSMIYEVSYSPAERSLEQVQKVPAGSEVILRGLRPATSYQVQVRVKLDGVSYNGYWSTWTHPVTMDTPSTGVDLLIVSLVVVISLIVCLLSVTLILSHHRFIVKKIWPAIPNPESRFQGLFIEYGGDFREWLGHTSGGLWMSPASFSFEEVPSPLEVLSELSPPPASPPLPPKASRASGASERWEEEEEEEKASKKEEASGSGAARQEVPHDRWLMEQLRASHCLPAPCSQFSLLESQDAYVTLNTQQHPAEEKHLDDIMEQTSPLEVLFAASLESCSDLGSLRQSATLERLSSGSSFESPDRPWPPSGPGYAYMAGADSGVSGFSVNYSTMSAGMVDDLGKTAVYNEYENQVWSRDGPPGPPGRVQAETWRGGGLVQVELQH
ncbi:hypothetical protein NHX12_032648 [Muraenolepis orangiensis]|uniref:Erythropoietin receptor n=1 Tax=Muraenolepis orangiensis TaxID=630683 RepID=A0A9Q0E9C9_9TELE|nr:hypothetical protein NHX12_032648 [Muraenolepis orangiensis]